MGFLSKKKGKGDNRATCGTCHGTGKIDAAWVENPRSNPPPHGNRHKATKRTTCPNCGGRGYG